MKVSFSLPENERSLIAILLLVCLVTRLPLLPYLPFVKDEGLYAVMIQEQVHNPTLVPTFLSYSVCWKPILLFWIYPILSSLFLPLNLPLEVLYRLPSCLFGLATIPVLYSILRNTGASKNISFFSVLIFLLSFPSIYSNAALLTDTLNFFFVSVALYFYTSKNPGNKKFLIAGLFVFLAFFVKLVVAFIAPVLAIAYYFTTDKKTLRDPLFLLSLLAAPLAFLIHFQLLETASISTGLSTQIIRFPMYYMSNNGAPALDSHGLGEQINILTGSASIFLLGAGVWFALSIFGVLHHWKNNLFMTIWYLFLVFPLLSSSFMIWYFLPVMPAVSYFAAMILIKWDNKERIDAFFILFFSMMLIVTAALLGIIYSSLYLGYIPEKEAGLFLSGKENVLIVGQYAPSILAYKALGEYTTVGRPLDFGWVAIFNSTLEESAEEYLSDYYTNNSHVIQGSFDGLFTTYHIDFRKDTNITKFDYIAVVGYSFQLSTPPTNSTLVYDTPSIKVYKMR